jgi:Holliday junction resolvase-like predicted endonuclease
MNNLKRAYRPYGRIYIDKDGREYPSVTTILGGTLKPGPWLEKWQDRMRKQDFRDSYEAAKLSAGEIPVYDIFDDALACPNNYRDNAGKKGTLYHEAIEAYLNENPIDIHVAKDERVKKVIGSFATWEGNCNLEPLHTEYFINSERWGYAGTIDLIAKQTSEKFGEQLVLVDFKTGSTQEDQKLQLAAYSVAYEEKHKVRPNIAFFLKVDVDRATVKETGHIHYHEISALFDVFLSTFKVWKWRTLKTYG